MSDYCVTQDFAFEGRVYEVGDILRLGDPLQARVISEGHQRVAVAEPVLRRAVSPLARVCRHGEIVPAGGSCARCEREKVERARRRGSTTARGYGGAHRALRKRLALSGRAKVEAEFDLRKSAAELVGQFTRARVAA